MQSSIRVFGTTAPGQRYVLRPGGYSMIHRDGRIAVVITPHGVHLPGGGQQDAESPEDAAIREAHEECGLRIRLNRCVGIADELVYAAEEQTYFRKRCTFFTADAPTSSDTHGSELDHRLAWLTTNEAMLQLHHESQRWMVGVLSDVV